LSRSALLREISLVCANMTHPKQVTSLYFGGGTPALLVDELGEIIDAIRLHFSIAGGIGVELHPNDITRENLEKLKAEGVTMVSIGIQSFDAECLRRLGRRNDDIKGKNRIMNQSPFEGLNIV